MLRSSGHLRFINQFLHKWHSLSSTASGLKDAKIELGIPWFYPKIYVFKTSKQDDSSHYIIEFKFRSESDNLSGLFGFISPHDLNSIDDLDSLFDIKNARALDTEWFSWPQPPLQPLFVGLIIKNPIFYDNWHPLLKYKSQKSLNSKYAFKEKSTKLLNHLL